MPIKIAPYKLGSKSAKLLANKLGVLRVRDSYTPKLRDTIINWGKSNLITSYPANVINNPNAVRIASNKLLTYQTLDDGEVTYLPEWTTSKLEAEQWITEGYKVYCRTTLTGHSGSGIVIASTIDELVTAPLYTRNSKSKYEYRVHVFKGNVIDVQQKKKRSDWEGTSIPGIRNFANGWVYAREGVECNSFVTDAAIHAVKTIGLDFGAVDIAYNQHDGKVTLYEVNTAPGIEGTTLDNYAQAFKELLWN